MQQGLTRSYKKLLIFFTFIQDALIIIDVLTIYIIYSLIYISARLVEREFFLYKIIKSLISLLFRQPIHKTFMVMHDIKEYHIRAKMVVSIRCVTSQITWKTKDCQHFVAKYTFSIIETMLLEILLNAKVCWSSNFFFLNCQYLYFKNIKRGLQIL